MDARDLTNEQEMDFTLSPTTSAGKSARIDGVPSYRVVSGQTTVVPAADGMSAVFRSPDDLEEEYDVEITADADLGDGVAPVTLNIHGRILSARAALLGGTFGTPRVKA